MTASVDRGPGTATRMAPWSAFDSTSPPDAGDACLGRGLPDAAEHALRRASVCRDDGAAEALLRDAVSLAPDHPASYIGLYRFYFYRHRLEEALAVGQASLALAARLNRLPEDWRDVRSDQADFRGWDPLPRFYLFVLKGCAYLNLRLGRQALGSDMLARLAALDPEDKLGGGVLSAVLERFGKDDE